MNRHGAAFMVGLSLGPGLFLGGLCFLAQFVGIAPWPTSTPTPAWSLLSIPLGIALWVFGIREGRR